MNKPWLKQPGECHDKNGIPIYPGDLLKTYHYTAARYRKKRYLYHVAVFDPNADMGAMRMVPVEHLDPAIREHPDHTGGNPLLSDDLAGEAEVISGSGPEDLMDYDERPRKTAQAAGGE